MKILPGAPIFFGRVLKLKDRHLWLQRKKLVLSIGQTLLFSQQVVLTQLIVSSRSSPDLKTFWDGGEDTYSTRRPFLKKNYKTNFFGYLSG